MHQLLANNLVSSTTSGSNNGTLDLQVSHYYESMLDKDPHDSYQNL